MDVYKEWTDFKTIIASKSLLMQYVENSISYNIWAEENNVLYKTEIMISSPASTDQLDFENNYKDSCNNPVVEVNDEGKQVVISTSRPKGTHTCFMMRDDDITNQKIGQGRFIDWDFSNSDDITTSEIGSPIPSGYKRKRIVLKFLDPIWLKEGAIYFFNVPKGAYVDYYVVCPAGEIYLKNDGTPAVASGDTPIIHYVCGHRMQGDCPMGDELNTEAASENPQPTNYVFWIEITTPDTDNTSNGYASIESYRTRSVILE